MVASQVARLGGLAQSTTTRRLRRLAELGLLVQEQIFQGQPAAVSITRYGLGAIESRLPEPHVDLRGYRHDVGVGWTWLAARDGAFGSVSEVISEREMRSHDLRAGREAEPYGIAVGGFDSHGRPARHYPDLLLVRPDGRRVAVELELSAKTPRRLDGIMRAYAGDSSISAVLYLVPDGPVRRLVDDAVMRAGIGDLVRVHSLAGPIEGAPELGARAGGRERPAERQRSPVRSGARSTGRSGASSARSGAASGRRSVPGARSGPGQDQLPGLEL